MAEIVFGFGTSHSPLLNTPPENWDLRAGDDKKNPAHPFRGKIYSFDELVELRKGENLAEQNAMPVREERYAKCQEHLKFLGRKLDEAAPDILVIMGNDQREAYLPDHTPAFLVYYGEDMVTRGITKEQLARMSPGIAVAAKKNLGQPERSYQGVPDLAQHLFDELIEDFDLSSSDQFTTKTGETRSIPHAFSFIFRRVMNGQATPILPLFTNTFFPPNQPRSKRVIEFGKAVGRAIQSWDSDKKVAVAATGGLSHFVVDEDLDRRMLDAIASRDEATIIGEPEPNLQSGTSEIKNWVATMGVTDGTGLEFQEVDYIPCYRSEAGTGNAMAFGLWT